MHKKEIIKDLERSGIREGDSILLHSSLKSLGQVEGGADAVIDAFLTVLGPQGNLAVPTMPFLGCHLEYMRSKPVFDVRKTPSRMGIITETLRLRAGARRSLHPSHSVAVLGPRAHYLTEGHEESLTPCSKEKSPYGRLIDLNGKIILLGVTNRSNTTLHLCEEEARVPYVLTDETYEATVIDYDGKRKTVRTYCHARGAARDFNGIEPLLLEKGIMTESGIGKTTGRIVQSVDLYAILVPLLRENPGLLLKK